MQESLLERGYDFIYDLFNGNPILINVVGGAVITNICFWIFNSFFILLDVIQPSWAMKYKIQDDKPVSRAKYFSALEKIMFNNIVVAMVMAYLSYVAGTYTGMRYDKQVPSWFTIVWQLLFCIVVEEIGFYYTHRLFHHRYLYKYVHKQHHEWNAPVSITSVYCHPLEHAISNLTPILFASTFFPPMKSVVSGPVVLGSHITLIWIWVGVAILSTTSSHSGYHFPLQPSPEAHDWHHKMFSECFGTLGILDWFHKTDTAFRESVNYKRDTSFAIYNVKTVHREEKKKEN